MAHAVFGKGNLEKVLTVLDAYGIEGHELELNRVKLAILQRSEGNREKLLYWVNTAKVDYRDALAAQQLGPLSPEEGAKLESLAKGLIVTWGKK